MTPGAMGDLKRRALALLATHEFYHQQEKTKFSYELQTILRELQKVKLELGHLIKAINGQEVTSGLETELDGLIRKLTNRVKVLPLEPILEEDLGGLAGDLFA